MASEENQSGENRQGRNIPRRNGMTRLATAVAGRRGRRLALLLTKFRPGRRFAILLTVAAVVAGGATYAALTGLSLTGPGTSSADAETVFVLLNIDLVLLLVLAVMVVHGLVRLWIQRRRGSAGSRLHTRLATLFSLIAAAPAIIVVVFSAMFFDYGIQGWFNERVSTALDQSLAVAEAYLEEHRQTIRADILAMATDINRDGIALADNPSRLQQVLNLQAALRNLPEAVIFTGSGRVLARTDLSLTFEFGGLPNAMMESAASGDVVVLTSKEDDRVRALVRLDNFVNTYLFVGRFVESTVLDHMERVQRAVSQYRETETRRSSIQITFTVLFVLVAVLLLLAAVWIGLLFARSIARPLSQLVAGAERVRAGDLSARVPEGRDDDEIASLSRAFNRMTRQLASQRRELVEANRQIDARRRFTEKVLEGVSAGVVGVDSDGRVTLANRSALTLLGVDTDQAADRPVSELLPEIDEPLRKAAARPDRVVQAEVEVERQGEKRSLMVRVAVEESGDRGGAGFVITFDDITDLQSAQRAAAWSDVARRIAHEIKNPLTPIQLSAERLKRRYLKQIDTDPETFVACTDTIIRQVDDIGRMVNEFSSFARMPNPVMAVDDIRKLVRESVAMQRMARSDISIGLDMNASPLPVECDSRQVSQALTNVVLNAMQAVEARREAEREAGGDPGRDSLPGDTDVPGDTDDIDVAVTSRDGHVVVEVSDRGCGLPSEDRERLAEPYVTTRAKGTGLGLAIVKKIMEDHGGTVEIEDRFDEQGAVAGARVRLTFALAEAGREKLARA